MEDQRFFEQCTLCFVLVTASRGLIIIMRDLWRHFPFFAILGNAKTSNCHLLVFSAFFLFSSVSCHFVVLVFCFCFFLFVFVFFCNVFCVLFTFLFVSDSFWGPEGVKTGTGELFGRVLINFHPNRTTGDLNKSEKADRANEYWIEPVCRSEHNDF